MNEALLVLQEKSDTNTAKSYKSGGNNYNTEAKKQPMVPSNGCNEIVIPTNLNALHNKKSFS